MVKADAKKYEEALVNLQRKIQSRQSRQLSFWSNLKSKPPQKPVVPSISFPSQSTSQNENENPSEVDKPVQGKITLHVILFNLWPWIFTTNSECIYPKVSWTVQRESIM